VLDAPRVRPLLTLLLVLASSSLKVHGLRGWELTHPGLVRRTNRAGALLLGGLRRGRGCLQPGAGRALRARTCSGTAWADHKCFTAALREEAVMHVHYVNTHAWLHADGRVSPTHPHTLTD
jgi:hypothetical protein